MEQDLDSALMVSVKEGDVTAFTTLFRRYSLPLLRYVIRFVGNAAVGEELVQDIFLKVYRNASSYEPRARFASFLYRIATNHCLNELRRGASRRRFESLDGFHSTASEHHQELPDPQEPGAEGIYMGQVLNEKIQKILLELPEKQRAAVLLNRFEFLSYREVSEVLKVSEEAVKSLLNRARGTIRKRLEDEYGKHI